MTEEDQSVNDQGKEVSLKKTLAYGNRYGILECSTLPRKEKSAEQLLVGFPKRNNALSDAIGMV